MSGTSKILPGTGRGTAEGGGGGSPPALRLAERPLRHAFGAPPPRPWEDLASDFPGLWNPDGTRWHYLDTAATSQKPQTVIDATTRALGKDYATVHRGV